MRALANIVILTQEQLPIVEKIIQSHLIVILVKFFNELPIDILQSKPKPFQRNFTLFFTHTLRLIIVCQSVSYRTLEGLSIDLQSLLRRFALFEIAFPLSKRLLDSLKGDVVWFKHDSSKCRLREFYTRTTSESATADNTVVI